MDNLPSIPIQDEIRFRGNYNTGVRRFPVGKDIPCSIESFTTTENSITFTCKWGPYTTDRGVLIRAQKETITYSDDDELLSPYKLLRLIKEVEPDAKFPDKDSPDFYPTLGEYLMNKHLLANSIEIKVKKENKPGYINKTKIIFLKHIS